MQCWRLITRANLLALVILFLNISTGVAQHPAWGKVISSKLAELCNEVIVSSSGKEIFLFGNFGDSLSIGNKLLVAQSPQNPFVIKYDTSGAVINAYQIKGSQVMLENASLAANGDIIIEGRFFEHIDFGNQVYPNQSMNSIPSTFVARITNSGELLWIKIFPDSGYGDIALSDNDDVYFFNGSFVEGPAAPTDNWLRKFNSVGEIVWETKFISSVYPTVSYPQAIDVLNGQIIIACTFNGDITISNTTLSAPLGYGFCVILFNIEGKIKHVNNLGTSAYNNAVISDLMINEDGGFYISGALPNQTMLARYDSSGNALWQKKTSGDSFGISYFSKGADGHIFMAADFYNSPVFEGRPLRGTNDSQFIINAPNIMVGEFSSSGELLSLNQFEPGNLTAVTSVALGLANDFYISGYSHISALKIGDLTLPMKNADGFSFGDGFLVKLIPKIPEVPVIPVLDLGPDVLLCKDETLLLAPKGFVKYTWQDNSNNPTFTVTKPGEYSVTTVDQLGNQSRDTVRVIACEVPVVFIPNVITPNEDTRNDFFEITGIDKTLNNLLTIYNRWGEKVYHEISYQCNWDASALSSGVYFYQFYDAATDKWYKGYVHVMK